MATNRSEASHSTFCCLLASSTILRAASTASAAVLIVPPSSWIPKETTGLSDNLRILSANSLWPTVSQPSPMTTAPKTFAFSANPVRTRWVISVFAATSEQPTLMMTFLVPNTWEATTRQVSEAHAQEGRIRTWLRTPTEPSLRLYPRNFIFRLLLRHTLLRRNAAG